MDSLSQDEYDSTSCAFKHLFLCVLQLDEPRLDLKTSYSVLLTESGDDPPSFPLVIGQSYGVEVKTDTSIFVCVLRYCCTHSCL